MSDETPDPTTTGQGLDSPASDSLSLHAARFGKTQPLFNVPPDENSQVPGDATGTDAAPNTERSIEAPWLTLVKAALLFCTAFVVFFVLLQAPAYYQRTRYSLTHLGSKAGNVTFAQLPKLQDRPISLTNIKADPTGFSSTGALAGYTLADLGDDTLLIPKIKIKTPIVWGSAPDESSMLTSLQRGVAHYDFTALPSDGQGNVFIAGHSSYLLWDKGKYKDVFANLDRIAVGDQVAVTYKGLVYIYEATATKVVNPTDISVLAQTPNPTLTLMTCVPVGTSKNRLIVSFKLVSASPNTPLTVPAPSNIDPASIFHYITFAKPADPAKAEPQ